MSFDLTAVRANLAAMTLHGVMPPVVEVNSTRLSIACSDLERACDEIAALRESLKNSLNIVRDLSLNPSSETETKTGRTVRLIFRGLIALSLGQSVLIIAANAQRAKDLAALLSRSARNWNIPHEHDDVLFGGTKVPNITAFGPGSVSTGFSGVTLVDHSAIERMEKVAEAAASMNRSEN
jgi:hypothetical protein